MEAGGRSACFAALGTTALVAVDDPAALEGAVSLLRRSLDEIDRACSRFRGDSELSRLNRSPGRPVRVGPLLIEALEVALRAADITDGDVDPTVGCTLRDLGYDRDFALVAGRGAATRPPVISARGRWRDVRLDPERRRVRIPPGVRLDLGATAKALAADRAARAIGGATGVGTLVSLGGDIAVCGSAPAGGWAVRVTEDHRRADGAGETIALHEGGLATSSTTVRRWRAGDARAHHIIDPRRGEPAAEVWRTVSVAAASCVDANIASTAAIVRGRAAPAWLERAGLPARLVARDGSVLLVGALAGAAEVSVLAHGNAVWFLMRGSGVVALLLLTGVMALGIATTGGVRLGSLPRFGTVALHRSISLFSVIFVGVHVATAVADPYAAVRLADVFLPFGARSHPLLIGLGALSVDLLLALIATSLLRARIGRRAWRAVHWAAYAAWPLAFLHAIGMGSDTSTLWLRALAIGALALVTGSLGWRVLRRPADPEVSPAPARPSRSRPAAGRYGRPAHSDTKG